MGKLSGGVMAGNVIGLFFWGIMFAGILGHDVGARPDTLLPAPLMLAFIAILPVVVLLASWHLQDSMHSVWRFSWFLWNLAWIMMTLFAALLVLEDRATEGGVPMWIADLAHSIIFFGIPMMLLNLLMLVLFWRSGSPRPLRLRKEKGKEQ